MEVDEYVLSKHDLSHCLVCVCVCVCRDTMGMKLLRRLGWRPGQGVGPRVSRRQKVSAQKEKRRLLANQGASPRGEARPLLAVLKGCHALLV